MKTPKVIQLNKTMSLLLEKKEDYILVIASWVQFIFEGWILYEEVDTLTVAQAREIEAKYTKQENWQFSIQDIEAIQEEVKTYIVRKPVTLLIGETNVIERIEKLSTYLID